MRKYALTFLVTSVLLVMITPTIIITHSAPKVFQLSKNKVAIIIDETQQQINDHLERAAADQQAQVL